MGSAVCVSASAWKMRASTSSGNRWTSCCHGLLVGKRCGCAGRRWRCRGTAARRRPARPSPARCRRRWPAPRRRRRGLPRATVGERDARKRIAPPAQGDAPVRHDARGSLCQHLLERLDGRGEPERVQQRDAAIELAAGRRPRRTSGNAPSRVGRRAGRAHASLAAGRRPAGGRDDEGKVQVTAVMEARPNRMRLLRDDKRARESPARVAQRPVRLHSSTRTPAAAHG